MTQTEALRLALDALECWQRNEDCNEPRSKIIGAIKAALEAKDEPIGYVSEGMAERLTTVKQTHEQIRNFRLFTHDVPLYTTPPQRTWVGLTDEEIEQGCKESWITEQAFQSAVWWAEAKLKEKNT